MTYLSELLLSVATDPLGCKRRARARYYAGYDWAISQLAKGEDDTVEAHAYDPYNDDEFNKGAREALRDWNAP